MTDNDIREAILLFEYSATARGGRGPVGMWPAKVVARLWRLYKTREVGFVVLKKKTQRGGWEEGRDGFDLQINPSYVNRLPKRNRLAAVSLTLVHEAVHAEFPHGDEQGLYSELAARKLAIRYYRELSGPGVINEEADFPGSKSPNDRRVYLPPGTFLEYRKMSDALTKEQLVDYVLRIDTYRGEGYDFNAQWVKANIRNWGGLRNRWPETRRHFVSAILRHRDVYYIPELLEILESIDSATEWTTLLTPTRLRIIQTYLDGAVGDSRLSPRIVALERKWKVSLTEQPGRL